MPDELLMRQVPQDLTAEQSLLGAMLVDPNCIPEVIEQVRADDFYAEENKRIFETIYSMFNGAQRIDPVTVLDMLTRMGYYDEAGGRAYLFQLMEVTPGARNVNEYVRIVRDKSLLRQLADAGCDACVMEVSSQGIMMDRVAGIHYKVGVFTNLYPDHIGPGEHSSFEEYRSWKGKLFQRCDVGVVNADDPNTEALLEGHTCKLVTYGIHAPKVDYRASEQYRLLRNKEMLGVEFTLTEPDGHTLDVQVGMPGLFSIYNALATIGVGKVLGLADAPIHEGLKKALVKGRVELVPISHKFTILIDYAHNEAATESLIETLREYNPNRLVVVFGCGGNRSKLRRYGMGEVCAKLADFSILTEDNNRFEKVEDIIADIKTGMAKGNPDAKYVEIPDRLDALHYAIDHAQEGDLIAVIGKGHEAYRDREGVKTPFLERELIEEYAAETGVE